jgi:hypothetical protein
VPEKAGAEEQFEQERLRFIVDSKKQFKEASAHLAKLKQSIRNELDRTKLKFQAYIDKVKMGAKSNDKERDEVFWPLAKGLAGLTQLEDEILVNSMKKTLQLFNVNVSTIVDAIKKAYNLKNKRVNRQRNEEARKQAIGSAEQGFKVCVLCVEKIFQLLDERVNELRADIELQQQELKKRSELRQERDRDNKESADAYWQAVAQASRPIEQRREEQERARMQRVAAVGVATGAVALAATTAGVYALYQKFFTK